MNRHVFHDLRQLPRQVATITLASMALLTCVVVPVVRAAEPLEYNRDIRPILAENCFACHGADSAARKADLRLDKREVAVESGAITAGKPDESELIARLFSDDPDLVMPPHITKKTLTAQQKTLLREWIAAGAVYQPHWSLIAPVRTERPAIRNTAWPRNAIDHFILAKLEAKGLTPAPEADPRTLFRRLHLDITGLPPTPATVSQFVADYEQRNDVALAEWIDQLMDSPAWGEHRARFWLDAARYADTHGLHFDNYREMWPYRDWVIRAFNANQPFDQFTVEQLAGDLLPDPSEDQLIATGFQRCNITTNEGGTIDEENLALYATDRVQTFGWVYLGLTTNCCQCHDHKFDPLTMQDYYSLAAFFRNTTQQAKDGNVKDGRGPVIMVPLATDRARWAALPDEITAAIAKRDERKSAARTQFESWLATATPESLDANLSTDGLVAHLPLNEGKGNQAASADGKSATFSATGNVRWIPDGKIGPAPVMKLGGTFDLGALGNFEKTQGFSCGAWIRAGNATNSGGIIARMDEKNAYRGWDLWQQGRSLAVHIVDNWPDNALKVATSDAVLKPKTWQHVFVTYDGSGTPDGISLYVDGAVQATKVETNTLKPDASIRTATSLRVGQRSDTQAFTGGAIQDVRLFSRSLTAIEIKAIAEIAPVRAILATATDQRSAEQQKVLYEFYLTTRDPDYPGLAGAVAALEAERESIRGRSPVTHVQMEREDSPAMAHILMRGEYDKPGDQVTAATPTALHAMPDGAPKNRLGLAQWLVDPANTLTARVTVNRFWQEIFGLGLVATPEDLGVMGASPSHPELLDWLAVDFRENGWNTKAFFKQILLSATYRQSAAVTAEKLEKDRDNALLTRGPRFRMAAETLRDYALAASGLLSQTMYGPGVKPYQPEEIWSIVGLPGGDTRNYVQDSGENLYRRSLYTFWKRMAPPPNLEAFNAPSREVCTVRRERTNTPLQALVSLNDPVFVEAARNVAQHALKDGGGDDVKTDDVKTDDVKTDDVKTIDEIARRVLCRPIQESERSVLLADQRAYLEYYQSKPDAARSLISVGESKVDDTLDVATLAAWTIVSNQVLNLDEVLNK